MLGNFLTGERIHTAFAKLRPIVHRTPILTSNTTNRLVGRRVYFKMENQQKTGAFKFRGATFKLMQLKKSQLQKGVITASAGNHAQGLAYAATKLDTKATIFMPVGTPEAKVEATKNYGAEVVLTGETFQEAYEASVERQKESKAVYVHPFDDVDIMAGQGTIALELLRQEDRIDTIIAPIGGGGLISGVATAAKHVNRHIQIIGVQAENSSAVYDSFHHQMRQGEDKPTIAEGIAVKEPGEQTLPIITKYVDDVVTVSDEQIASAMIYMLERNKMLVEGAGAAALAALFAYHEQIASRHTGIIISGGNMDVSMMPRIQQLAQDLSTNHVTKKLTVSY